MNTPGNTTDGSPWVGTNVFARNVNGNSHPNVVWSASVGLDTDRPTSVPTQIIANPNNTSSPYARPPA